MKDTAQLGALIAAIVGLSEVVKMLAGYAISKRANGAEREAPPDNAAKAIVEVEERRERKETTTALATLSTEIGRIVEAVNRLVEAQSAMQQEQAAISARLGLTREDLAEVRADVHDLHKLVKSKTGQFPAVGAG